MPHRVPSTFAATSIYIRTLAWALGTMSSLGYGNAPTAFADMEHLFAICAQVRGNRARPCTFSSPAPSPTPAEPLATAVSLTLTAAVISLRQVVGACVAAGIFGNIAQMINKGDTVANRYQDRREKMIEFVRFHHLARGGRGQELPEPRPRKVQPPRVPSCFCALRCRPRPTPPP